MVIQEILMIDCNTQLSQSEISLIEEKIKINFPESYVAHVRICDGGYPNKRCFTYFDEDMGEKWTTSLSRFLALSGGQNSKLLQTYQSPPEFFPDGLIAFAEIGNGDLLCFDYRQGKDNPNPPIAYWNHEADIGQDVSFIANDFEEFINMLEEPEEI